MNFKEMKVEVDRLLSAGHSKYDVFNRMSGHGVTNDKLALIIALYADPSRIAANKIWINILLTLIFIQVIISFFVGLGQGVNSHSDVAWLWGVGAVIIPLGCLFNIYKNHALGYTMYLSSLMLSFKGAIDIAKTTPSAALIAVSVITGIGGYTWFVKRKVFPDLVLFKARKVNDSYIFTYTQTNSGPFSAGNISQIHASYNKKIKNIWIIISLIFYVLSLAFISTSFSIKLDRRWVFDFEVLLHCAAIICIVFYIFDYRPRFWILLFKALPISLIVIDIVWWSRYSIVFEGDIHISIVVLLAAIFCITTAPAWYLCFRYAYPTNTKSQ